MSSKSTGANERVKVYCRLRPQIVQEATPEDVEDPTFVTGTGPACVGEAAVTIAANVKSPRNGRLMYRDGTNAKEFEFDGCFAQDATQTLVYQTVAKELVQSVLQGYNATIMAYGQTGSGKTHTMMGGEDQGIIPRCLGDLFDSKNHTRIHLSYVQIYCERVFDLLEPSTAPTALSIRESEEEGVFVDGVQKRLVHNVEECLEWIQVGNANRTVAATKMNAHSSRSHAIISIHVERIDSSRPNNEIIQKSQFHLVDLAGSERVKKSLIRGTHVNELKAINLSLSALGNCISALSKQQSHIPYRDSKLTRLLQYSLGGNAKTALVLTVTPEMTEASESHATLQFGQRAMQIQVQARVNIVPDYKRLVEQLQAKVDAYEDKLNGMDIELQSSRDQQALLLNQLDEAKVDASKFAFEVEALKTAMQMQAVITHQQETPRNDQETNGNGEADASPPVASSDILEQMEAKLHDLTMQHRKELNTLKQRFDFQVETHKQVANRANQEWQNIEHELSSERTAHLETCRELREAKEKYFSLESNHVDRIAEMCQEKKELELQNQAQLKLIEQLKATTSSLELQVKQLQQGKSELSLSIDANFVSREQVNEMEALYSDAITKLQLRVESLEANKATKAPEPVRLPPPITRKDSLVKKAVPKIGRVMPGGRRCKIIIEMDTEERAEAFSSSRYRRPKLPRSLLIFSIVVAVGAAIGAVVGVIITIKYKAQQASTSNTPPSTPSPTQQTQPESTALLSSSTPSSDAAKESFDFHAFGIGNWAPGALAKANVYRTDNTIQKSVAELMATTAKSMSPQFILSHGGNLLLSGGRAKREAQFDALFTKMYADESLATAPWLNVMGDVEYGGGNYLCSNYSTEAASTFIPCGSNSAMLKGLQAKVLHIQRSRHSRIKSQINDTRWILRDQVYKYSAHSNGIIVDSFHLNLQVPKIAHVICCQCFGYGGSCPKSRDIDSLDDFPQSCAGGHESWYEDCRDEFDASMDDAFDALKEALQLSSATWKIVHAHASALHDIPAADRSKWLHLLNQFNVQLWINGHAREASHFIFQTNATQSPIHFWTNGLGGGRLPSAPKKANALWHDTKDGFLALSFSALWVKVQYLSPASTDPVYCYFIPQSGLGSGQSC